MTTKETPTVPAGRLAPELFGTTEVDGEGLSKGNGPLPGFHLGDDDDGPAFAYFDVQGRLYVRSYTDDEETGELVHEPGLDGCLSVDQVEALRVLLNARRP